MTTMTCTASDVNTEPAEIETTGPTADDDRWLAEQQTGGCVEGDMSPEDRRIASAQSALNRFWDLLAGEREATDAHEAGYAFY